jgi:hypothetical protein
MIPFAALLSIGEKVIDRVLPTPQQKLKQWQSWPS